MALWPGAGVEDDEQAPSATATTLAAVMLTRAVRRDTKILLGLTGVRAALAGVTVAGCGSTEVGSVVTCAWSWDSASGALAG